MTLYTPIDSVVIDKRKKKVELDVFLRDVQFFRVTFEKIDVGLDDFLLSLSSYKARNVTPHPKARIEFQNSPLATIGVLMYMAVHKKRLVEKTFAKQALQSLLRELG